MIPLHLSTYLRLRYKVSQAFHSGLISLQKLGNFTLHQFFALPNSSRIFSGSRLRNAKSFTFELFPPSCSANWRFHFCLNKFLERPTLSAGKNHLVTDIGVKITPDLNLRAKEPLATSPKKTRPNWALMTHTFTLA